MRGTRNAIATRAAGECFHSFFEFSQSFMSVSITCYNIASRAVQSNSIYISVLKIPIVHADSVSKSLRKKIFPRECPLLAQGKIIYFATMMETNRDSAFHSQNEDNFLTFSLGLEFLNKSEKEKNNRKGDSASALSRFTSLSEGEMQQTLTERHSGKTKQMTSWSVSTFKGKPKIFPFTIVNIKLELSTENLK